LFFWFDNLIQLGAGYLSLKILQIRKMLRDRFLVHCHASGGNARFFDPEAKEVRMAFQD